jgi:hypothetical protein
MSEQVDSNQVFLPDDVQEDATVKVALLINALKCIDAAAQRGAYQGGELSQVGHVRDTLYAHSKDVIEAIEKSQQEQTSEGQ